MELFDEKNRLPLHHESSQTRGTLTHQGLTGSALPVLYSSVEVKYSTHAQYIVQNQLVRPLAYRQHFESSHFFDTEKSIKL